MPDGQAAHETTLTGLTVAFAGVNIIYGLGMFAQGITFDYAQLLIDNEIARMIKEVVGGIRVDRATMTVFTRLRSIVKEAEDHYQLELSSE